MARKSASSRKLVRRRESIPTWVLPTAMVGGAALVLYFGLRGRRSPTPGSQLDALLGGGASGGAGAQTPGRTGGSGPRGTGGAPGTGGTPSADTTPKPQPTGGGPTTFVSGEIRELQRKLARTDCPFPVPSTGIWDDDTRMATMWALTQMNGGNSGAAATRIHALDADHGPDAIGALLRELCYLNTMLALGATYTC